MKKYLLLYKIEIISASICSIANQIFDLLPEIFMGIAIDLAINKEQALLASYGFVTIKTQLALLGIGCLIIWTFETIFQYGYLHLWRTISQNIQKELRLESYKHLQSMDLIFFEEKSTGELLSLLHEDVNQIERFLDTGVNTIIQLITSTLITIGVFLYTSPTLTLLTLLPTPFLFIITWIFQEQLEILHHEVRKQAALLSAKFTNNLLGIITIKSYTTEKKEFLEVARITNNYTRAQQRLTNAFAAFRPIVRLSITLGFIITVIIGGWYAIQGIIPIGTYSSLIFLTQRLLWPFTEIAELVNEYKRSKACINRIYDLLNTKNTIFDGKQLLPKNTLKGAITYQNISLTYPNGTQIFKNFSCFIPAKKTTAFVGKTGSGKSSLIKLILRLYDPQEGDIFIDKYNIKDITLESLRQSISFISQDPFLFHGSIYHNIAYGSTHFYNSSIIRHAAQAAQIDTFIESNPSGYQFCVGEKGKKLSGGQRQRVTIARAIVKNAPIFIFDEATSAIDAETEKAFHKSLIEISKKNTTIIIAHKLATIRHADIIHVLDNGCIVESGNHNQLITSNNIYAYLWRLQIGSENE